MVLRKSAFSKTTITIRSKYLPGTMPLVDETVEGWSIGTADTAIIMAVTEKSSFMACLAEGEGRKDGFSPAKAISLTIYAGLFYSYHSKYAFQS